MTHEMQPNVINLLLIVKKILTRKKLFARNLLIAFVVAVIYILGFPRYYSTSIKLAPELGGTSSMGMLGSVASSFGFDLDNMQREDAITPKLYPDLMEDNAFVTNLFQVNVTTKKGDVNTNYRDYLQNHQKQCIWLMPIAWIKSLLPKPDEKESSTFDPYNLSESDNSLANAIKGKVKIQFDKKNDIITISVTDQDPVVCKTLADSIKERLQLFIIDYRTSKARIDLKYYTKLAADAKLDYERARQRYGSYSDANMDMVLESYRSKQEDLENDMQLRFNAYSTINTQLQIAKAKIQERTPAFTTIKGAEVPVRPSGPKRMIFVLGVLIATFIGTSFYVLQLEDS